MPFEPGSGNCSDRDGKKQHIKYTPHRFGDYSHPARDGNWLGSPIYASPDYPEDCQREDAGTQRLVKIAVEIAGARIDTGLRSAGSVEKCGEN